MSVLLDALKKAAEEKQKRQAQVAAETSGSVTEFQAPAAASQNEDTFVNLSLLSKAGSEQVESSSSEAPEPTMAEENADLTLNLLVSAENQEDPSSKAAPEPEKVVFEEAPLVEEAVIAPLFQEEAQRSDSVEADSNTTDDVQLALEVELGLQEGEADVEPDVVEERQKKSESNGHEAMVFQVSAAEPEAHRIDLETALALESDSVAETPTSTQAVTPPTQHESTAFEKAAMTPSSQRTESTRIEPQERDEAILSETQPQGVKEDKDWSLDQIPAYQKETAPVSHAAHQSKMETFLAVFHPKKSASASESNNHLHAHEKRSLLSRRTTRVLLAILGLFILVYFALSYYLSQKQQVDQSLTRYQLKPQPMPVNKVDKVPVKTEAQPVKQEESAASKANQDTIPREAQTVETLPKEVESKSLPVEKNTAEVANESSLAKMPVLSEPQVAEEEKNESNETKEVSSSESFVTQPSVQPEVSKIEAKQPEQRKPVVKRPLVAAPSRTEKSKIEVVSQPEETDEVLAFQAYESGDYIKAKQLYQQALKKDRHNIPALYGLAAIATHQGETHRALTLYESILQLDPNQTQIKSIVLALKAEEIEGTSTQALLQWANSRKGDDLILFTLAKRYANQEDWLNAQKYFFEAFSLKPNSAEYALNLAVSLDHLGEYALAKKYYQQSLMLAKHERFDVEAVKARMIALEHFLGR